MKTIDVCLTPDLIHLYKVTDKVVVVVDILRATSCMVTGVAHGVAAIRPFSNLEACRKMKNEDYLIAGERDGKKVEDFDLGNSPFDYMHEQCKGKAIAVTTTNGTVAIEKSKQAVQVIIGAFLNIKAVADYLKNQEHDVLIVCAGWKGKVNMEDSLFAGALAALLKDDFSHACDVIPLIEQAYERVKDDLLTVVQGSSHAKRLERLDIHEDISFCLKFDEYDVVPVLRDGLIAR